MDEKIVKDSQGLVKDLVNDTISRQAAIEAIKEDKIDLTNTNVVAVFKATGDFEKVETQVMTCDRHIEILKDLPSAQPECAKDFVMLKVIDLNGRPYYSIIYLENGNEFEGYSSYDLMVISEYLKRYFGFAQPEIIRCRDCKHHTNCTTCGLQQGAWFDDSYCSYGERREVSE